MEKKEKLKTKKVPTKKYTLKRQFTTDKGIKKAGETIELGEKGATDLKSKNII
jgi:hypothetical protein